jgi:acetyl-CoA carboxylase biotin carboxyl carrier protein
MKKKRRKKPAADVIEQIKKKFQKTFKKEKPIQKEASYYRTNGASDDVEEKRYVTINTPLAGIFHRNPSPHLPPFVEVGNPISKGQVVCIIEAMKIMNEIHSDTSGTIVKILVENGQSVGSGQPLFLIKLRS